MKERECLCVGQRERVHVSARLCVRMTVSACVCACLCVCVCVCKRERESARAHALKKEREIQRGSGEKWGGQGGERDRVYVQVYARESLCACTSVSEWKRENVSMFESERESVCLKA